MAIILLLFNRDAIMKEDPDKPRKIRNKNSDEGEDESPGSPLTDVSIVKCAAAVCC